MLSRKSTMRVILIGLISVFLVSCGQKSPQITLETVNGNFLTQSDWDGKWVYINYWAEWCKPCIEEIPELNKFAAANPDVLVMGVDFDKPNTTEQLRHVNALRINFYVITTDLQKVFPHALPQGLPATIVINPEGKIVDTLQGPQTVATLMQAMKQ